MSLLQSATASALFELNTEASEQCTCSWRCPPASQFSSASFSTRWAMSKHMSTSAQTAPAATSQPRSCDHLHRLLSGHSSKDEGARARHARICLLYTSP